MLAVLALCFSLYTFWVDYQDRVQERTVRAWQLLTTPAPGNSGKVAALEYLNSVDGLICWGATDRRNCWPRLKTRAPLNGIDLRPPAVRSSVSDNSEKGEIGTGAYLASVRLPRAILSSARLDQADLSNAQLSWASLDGANLSNADLRRADLSWANLNGANLSGANLVNADLQRAFLDGANLSNADLRRADLSNATLINAILINADLSGAYLSETFGLNENQLGRACGSDQTLLPDDLTVPLCSDVKW